MTESITSFIDTFSLTYNSDVISGMVPKIEKITSIRKNEAFNIIVFFNEQFDSAPF